MSTLVPIHPRAIDLINQAIRPLLYRGCRIAELHLYVCYQSEIAQHDAIETAFGKLHVRPSYYIPKGYSYIREYPGKAFSWVTIRQPKESKAI
ncbi:hypothetical protein B9T62_34550 [Paenibacillus donghaensis]|uniref:Uncharacterized protein n=1 Tax=Paenibacillus donghaensis TaxID=414771 RepID=A0A2Z2KY97_9BACL|nr:hypothetical protein B9T62_34550 [Paenibacillus donghaensis]